MKVKFVNEKLKTLFSKLEITHILTTKFKHEAIRFQRSLTQPGGNVYYAAMCRADVEWKTT
ncbi:hypothetical protein ZOSMA_342G00240 [Zostera marina]|uniref:Uncharacterized protein n=1 Tax=Zostera marina TaxID=29655 RepID=A0A0K9P7F8_ZOSMR|nr:hypothetical protein ZOSMA_342G00240 [Zostera marina]